MTFNSDLETYIQERIEAARPRTTAIGTVTDDQLDPWNPTPTVYVAFDGSSVSVPVKRVTNVLPFNGDRVTLVKHGSEWIISGVTVAAYRSANWSLLGIQQAANSTTATFTFSNIPAKFQHLRVEVYGRTLEAVRTSAVWMYFNGNVTGYDTVIHYFYSNGAGVWTDAANGFLSQSAALLGWLPGTTVTASVPGAITTEIPYYGEGTFRLSLNSHGGYGENGATQFMELGFNGQSAWQNTAVINSVAVSCPASTFVQGTTFALYGWGT